MNNIIDFLKKHKVLSTIIIVLILIVLFFVILFNINPEMFNYKTITYRRSEVCNTMEIVSYKVYEKELDEILGTSKYSDKMFVVNNYNINFISFKSYKNKPAKKGDAVISLKVCRDEKTREIEGKYEFIKDYVIVSFRKNIFIFYFDKKSKSLIDYNTYVQEGKEKYYLK